MATHTLLSRRFNTDHETPQARSLIKLRLPSPLTGPNGSSISSSAVTGATRHNYHTVIVRFAFADIRQRCIHMSVWPVPAYSGAASSTQWLASQPLAQRSINIPFPCEADDDEPRPTPAAFGPPLQLAGYRDRRPSWVLLQPQNFDLPYSQMWKRFDPAVLVPQTEMDRLELYYDVVAAQTTLVAMMLDPPPSPGVRALFSTLFGADLEHMPRLPSESGSDSDAADDDDAEARMDPYEYLRLLAPGNRYLTEIVQRHDGEEKMRKRREVSKWMEQVEGE